MISRNAKICCSACVLMFFLFTATNLLAQTHTNETKLLDDYINSKGYKYLILFDSSNIKQFWTSKEVFSKDGLINIILNQNDTSSPLKVQLANVNETLDCKVDIITKENSLNFSVLDSNLKVLSPNSVEEEDFIQYHVLSSKFHLENTLDNAFCLKFSSKEADVISINKIVLSFSDNKDTSFLSSPGVLTMSKDTISSRDGTITWEDNNTITIKANTIGTSSRVISNKKIYASENACQPSLTIKNIGKNKVSVLYGFGLYSKNHVRLEAQHYPFILTNKPLSVVSAAKGSSAIIVDSVPEKWNKNCTLAINASDDFSDIPNTNLVNGNGKIIDIKALSDGQAEITINSPLKEELKSGTKLRVHNASGTFLYTNSLSIQPGEEANVNASIKKDDSLLEYSSKAFSRGVYYVVPMVFSNSNEEDNIIQIKDYTISY